MRLSPSEGLSSSKAVFTGEVIAIEKNKATRFGGLEVTLRVKEVWKGAVEAKIKVHTAGSSAACGFNFLNGQTYLVYAVSDQADPMRVSLCSRTTLVENAKEDLRFLGKPSHRFADADSRRKDKTGGCGASPGNAESSGVGWMVLLLAGATLMRRRLA